jgi:hypothetical protein
MLCFAHQQLLCRLIQKLRSQFTDPEPRLVWGVFRTHGRPFLLIEGQIAMEGYG